MSRGAVVLAASGLVFVSVAATGGLIAVLDHTSRTAAASARRSTVAAPMPSTSGGVASSDVDTPWSRVSDGAQSEEDYLARLNNPANSDLDPALAGQLAQLGARFLRADVSGAGRGDFGDYWGGPGGASGPCCRQVVVLAAAAQRHAGRDDVVDVAVIWSAQRAGGGAVGQTTTVVNFANSGGSWRPLHPWELP